MIALSLRRLIVAIALIGAQTPLGPASAATLNTPADWQGFWRGRYVCAQGATGLTLSVKPAGAHGVVATFSFHALAENPSVPSGQFKMTGQLGPAGHLRLVAKSWTHQPLFYVMVGLDGDYDPASAQYKGVVDGPGCTEFVVQRDLVS